MLSDYIRVSANVYDSYAKISEVYSVAFANPQNDDEIKQFVKTDKTKVFQMFNPINGATKTNEYGDFLNVISYIPKVYANVNDTSPIDVSSPTTTDIYTYIYTMNDSGYELIANVYE